MDSEKEEEEEREQRIGILYRLCEREIVGPFLFAR